MTFLRDSRPWMPSGDLETSYLSYREECHFDKYFSRFQSSSNFDLFRNIWPLMSSGDLKNSFFNEVISILSIFKLIFRFWTIWSKLQLVDFACSPRVKRKILSFLFEIIANFLRQIEDKNSKHWAAFLLSCLLKYCSDGRWILYERLSLRGY